MLFPVGRKICELVLEECVSKMGGGVLTRKAVRVKMEISDVVLRVGIRNA